jgi:hypothetical protein
MVEFKTLREDIIEYGNNKFIEVAVKITDSDGKEYMNIAKGYHAEAGEKRYQKALGFPNDPKIIEEVIAKMQKVSKGKE